MADEKNQGYSGTHDQQSDKQQKNQQNQPDTFKKNPSQGTGQEENQEKRNQEQGGQRRAS
jgi:hypothetical protein